MDGYRSSPTSSNPQDQSVVCDEWKLRQSLSESRKNDLKALASISARRLTSRAEAGQARNNNASTGHQVEKAERPGKPRGPIPQDSSTWQAGFRLWLPCSHPEGDSAGIHLTGIMLSHISSQGEWFGYRWAGQLRPQVKAFKVKTLHYLLPSYKFTHKASS